MKSQQDNLNHSPSQDIDRDQKDQLGSIIDVWKMKVPKLNSQRYLKANKTGVNSQLKLNGQDDKEFHDLNITSLVNFDVKYSRKSFFKMEAICSGCFAIQGNVRTQVPYRSTQ